MALDIQPVNSGSAQLDIQPLDIQPVDEPTSKPELNGPPPIKSGVLGKRGEWRHATDEEGLNAYRKLGRLGLGVAETGLNVLGGAGGAFVAPVLGALDAARGGNFFDTYEKSMQMAGSTGSTLADITGLRTDEGDTMNVAVGNVLNTVLAPIGGMTFAAGHNANLRGMMPEAFRKPPKEIGHNVPVAEILKDEPKASAVKLDIQPVPQWETPPVMPVTPEGQGILSPADMAWRLRAQQMEAEAKANQPRPPMPESQGPIQVTPEGQGVLPGDVRWRNQGEAQIAAERAAMAKDLAEQEAALEPWKQRALFLQKQAMAEQAAREAPPPVLRAEMARPETEQTGATVGTPAQMEGLRASTEGISYENIPPGGVVPRSAPTKGLEAPRKGQWVVDENGMPVRQGFAPEHELGPPMHLPIREGANDLGNAIQEANGPKLGVHDYWGSKPLSGGYVGKQRGALNLDIFDPAFDMVKRLDERFMFRVRGPRPETDHSPVIQLIDKEAGNKAVGSVKWGRDAFARMPDMDQNLEAMWTTLNEPYRESGAIGKGRDLSRKMYEAMNSLGNDIVPSHAQLEGGKGMWRRFGEQGYTGKMTEAQAEGAGKKGWIPNKGPAPEQIGALSLVPKEPSGYAAKQAGKIDFQGIADSVGDVLKRVRDKFPSQVAPVMSAQELATRAQERAKAQVASNVLQTKMPRYYDPMSGEEAAAMAAARPNDIKSNPFTRSLASGMGFMATYHDNPLLKYARRVLNKANEEATQFINQYVHGEGGTTEAMNRLSSAERVRLVELINHLDKNEIAYTPEIGDRVGLTEGAKKYMDAWNRAAEAEWEWNKQVHASQGIEQAPYRRGYAPSMDSGSYISLVTVGDRVIGKITADTPGDFFKGKQYYAKKYEGAKFSAETPREARIPIGGRDAGKAAGRMKDIAAFINLMTNEDNSYSAIQQKANQLSLSEAMRVSNFNYHNFAKKGIEGSLGDRPWLSAEKNANDRLESMNRFLTDSAKYHSLQAPIEELNGLMGHDSFSKMTNAKEYLTDYLDNVGGRYINDLGKAANAVANFASKLPESIPIVNKVFGPRAGVHMSNAIKNRLSQLYMGWFNTAFMVSQLVQPIQNGIPIAMMVARDLGLSAADVSKSIGKGYADFVKFDLHDNGIWKSRDVDLLDAAKFAQDRGIMNFTEGERAYTGDHAGAVSRGLDYYGNITMKLGEHAGRTPVFFAMYDLAKKAGIDKQNALELAENLTNQIMANYHPNERPLAYQGMGVLGPHAGALTTWKHNFVGTQALLAKYGKESGNYAPAAASAAIMIALAGVTGLPGYDDLDKIYQEIRSGLTGKQRSIRQDMLATLPEWVKTGVVSNVIGLNAQNKFSASQILGGDNPAAVISPYGAGAYDIGKTVYEAAKDPTKANVANAALAVTPQGFKQFAKSQLQRGEPAIVPEGQPHAGQPGHWLLDRSGRNDVIRSDEDWKRAAMWGLTPQQEAIDKANLWQNKKNVKVQEEARKKAVMDFQAAVAQKDNARINKALKDYQAAGGYPPALIKSIGKTGMQGQMSSQQRAERIPKSPSSINRYEEFQNK